MLLLILYFAGSKGARQAGQLDEVNFQTISLHGSWTLSCSVVLILFRHLTQCVCLGLGALEAGSLELIWVYGLSFGTKGLDAIDYFCLPSLAQGRDLGVRPIKAIRKAPSRLHYKENLDASNCLN